MKLTRLLQDTVCLMEGGHVNRTRRPGEYFDQSANQRTLQLKGLPARLLLVLLGLFG